MLKLESKKIHKVEIDGVVYDFRSPTVKESAALAKSAKDLAPEDNMEFYVGFIAQLGIPKDIVEQLSVDALTQLTGLISEVKKS